MIFLKKVHEVKHKPDQFSNTSKTKQNFLGLITNSGSFQFSSVHSLSHVQLFATP